VDVIKRRHWSNDRRAARRGTLLVDAIIGAIVMGVAISMLVPALTAVRRQRQAIRFESLAMLELRNIDEMLGGSLDAANPPKLSEWFHSRYSDAQLTVEILPASSDEAIDVLQPARLTIHRPTQSSLPDQQVAVIIWTRAVKMKASATLRKPKWENGDVFQSQFITRRVMSTFVAGIIWRSLSEATP